MNGYIRDLNELTDSREMLEARPRKFVVYFIYILILLVFAVALWSYFGEIDTVAKANAIVRPNENTSTIQTAVQSKVEKVVYKQGEKVESGDVLLVLDSEELEVQIEAVEKNLLESQKELDDLNKFKESVEQQRNLLNKESRYNEAYEQYEINYNKLKKELESTQLQLDKIKLETDFSKTQMENKENLLQSSQKEMDLTLQTLEAEKEKLLSTLSNLKELEKSYLGQKNFIDDQTSQYYHQFIEFQNTITQLQNNLEQKKSDYENAKGTSESDVEQKKVVYEAAKVEVDNYINASLKTVRSEIQSVSNNLKATELEIKKFIATNSNKSQEEELENEKKYLQEKIQSLNDEIAVNDDLQKITLEKFKADKLVEINNLIEQQENVVDELQNQLNQINSQIKNYQITAPIDGVINVHKVVNKGDIIHPGETILNIIPTDQKEYKMVISVLNEDISKMKVGNTVKYQFSALPYKEYGALEGEITSISTDTFIHPENGMSYYTVEATLKDEPLYSYKGKEETIKIGMQAEALVVTDSKKIFHYVLEKINLKD